MSDAKRKGYKRAAGPFKYPGGKFRLRKILAFILEGVAHEIYCEPFGGAASVLIAKEPVPIEIYNDLDDLVANFFYVISHPRLFKEFRRRVNVIPFSRGIFERAKRKLARATRTVEKAVWWFVVQRQSFSGVLGRGWARTRLRERWGMAACVAEWLRAIEGLPDIAHRMARVLIDCRDGIEAIKEYDSPQTVFYCDPPYHPDTRTKEALYRLEVDGSYHDRLVDTILQSSGTFMLSAYEHSCYQPLLDHGYGLLRIHAKSHIPSALEVPEKNDRIEAVYLHPRIVKESADRLAAVIDRLAALGKLAGHNLQLNDPEPDRCYRK